MATHDYVIDNSTGANVRADINNVLQAILTNNSNSSTPTTTEAYMWWADTTANIFKIRNSANNAWINLFTLAGGIDVDAASSFNEDVSFLGANYQIVFDKSENAFEFGNDAKAKFGTDDDLEIFHESSSDTNLINSHKELKLFSNGNTTLFTNNAETMVKGIKNGAVELYHDNSKKFETESSGCKIDGSLELTANLIMSDNDKIRIGNSQDLEIYHDGSHSYIADTGTGNLRILTSSTFTVNNAANSQNMILATDGGNVELYYAGNKKLETLDDGVNITGTLKVNGSAFSGGGISNVVEDTSPQLGGDLDANGHNINVDDNNAIYLGNSNDLSIFHLSGGSSVIRYNHNVGGLRIRDNNNTEIAMFNSSGNFQPGSNNAFSLGTSTARWSNIFTSDLSMSNEGSKNDVDGTWGSYTIQEGAESLFLINKRNGKKYKFNITEVM